MFLKKKIIFFVILILIIGLAGVSLYYLKFSKIKIKKESVEKINISRGVIQDLNDKIIKIKAKKSVPLSQSAEKNDNYVITAYSLGKETVIYKYINQLKDTEKYSQEKEQFNQKMEKLLKENKDISSLGLETPSRYIKKKISWRDLKKGEIAEVFFYRDKEKLIAQKIIILSEIKPKITPFPLMSNDNFKFFGRIKEISPSQILLNIDNINPAATTSIGETKKILTDENTIVVKKIKKTEKQFKQEQSDYIKKLQLLADNTEFSDLKAPSWFKEYKIKLADLKKKSRVKIEGILDKNGKYLAKKIEYYSN